MEEQKGFEFVREVGVDADFLTKLVPVLEIISRPLHGEEKMRVVSEYDPLTYKVKFKYYRPIYEQDGTEHQ